MSNIALLNSKARNATLRAVVTRADGTQENLGVIAYYHWFAPWRWLVNALISIKRYVTG
jgi:hypothetical protein